MVHDGNDGREVGKVPREEQRCVLEDLSVPCVSVVYVSLVNMLFHTFKTS